MSCEASPLVCILGELLLRAANRLNLTDDEDLRAIAHAPGAAGLTIPRSR